MVQAILNGTKTQTRRIFKDHPRLSSDVSKVDLAKWFSDFTDYILSFSQYGKTGDILWVRETFMKDYFGIGTYAFKAGWQQTDELKKKNANMCAEPVWKPSIHMPKSAARIWLKITDIRIERLQDISEEDVKREGVKFHNVNGKNHYLYYPPKNKNHGHYCGPCRVDGTYITTDTAFYNDKPHWHSFRSLWESINSSESWAANPWVWVITFEKIER